MRILISEAKILLGETSIKEINKRESKEFLIDNHIQGYSPGDVSVGLFYSETLVSLAQFRIEKKSGNRMLNLVRYATSTHVVGGFSKIISYIEKNYNEVTGIFTFSDNCVSDGSLYSSNGFVVDSFVDPDYFYLVRGKRFHKFEYKLDRFRYDPKLSFVEGLSELQLGELNNLVRVWDAGKVKWVKKFERAVV